MQDSPLCFPQNTDLQTQMCDSWNQRKLFFSHCRPVDIKSSAAKHACADKPKPVCTTHVHAHTHTYAHTQWHELLTVDNSVLSRQAPAKSLNCKAKNASSKMCDFRPLLITFLELGQWSNFQENQLRQFTVAHQLTSLKPSSLSR